MSGVIISSGRPPEHHGRGVALRLGAISAVAAMMAALKYCAGHGVSPPELLFYRNLFSLPTIIVWVQFSGGFSTVRTNRPFAHAMRSGLGLVVMFMTFLALSKLPLAMATVIGFSAPLFATMLSALVLRETVSWHRWAAIVLGFIGVLIAIQPGAAPVAPLGVVAGLVSALGTAMVVITLRQIGATESAVVTVFWFNIICLVVTALPMPFLFRNQNAHVWLALALGGLAGGGAQIMMTAAVRYAPVSVLAPFDYLQIVWATVWGYVLFSTLPSAGTVTGAVLITTSGFYVMWRERRQRKLVVPAPNEL